MDGASAPGRECSSSGRGLSAGCMCRDDGPVVLKSRNEIGAPKPSASPGSLKCLRAVDGSAVHLRRAQDAPELQCSSLSDQGVP